MLRIRKDGPMYRVTIRYETTCAATSLESCIAGVKETIGTGMDRLELNADAYDEVRIDKDGSLHSKVAAPEPDDNDDAEGG